MDSPPLELNPQLRCLVSGASSQIGRFLLPRLCAAGHEVIALSRRPPPDKGYGVRWLQADLTDLTGFSPGPVECVLHLAGLPLLPELLARLDAPPLRRVIAFSSTSRFTKQSSAEVREQQLAEHLAQAENALADCCAQRGLAWTLFRPTLVYGCGLDRNISFIARFVRRFGFFPLLGPGRGLRQPVHADDLALACVQALPCLASYGQAYNLSGGETLSYREMVKVIFAAQHRSARLLRVPGWVLRSSFRLMAYWPGLGHLSPAMLTRMNADLCFDHSAASRDFGYQPRGFKPKDLGV